MNKNVYIERLILVGKLSYTFSLLEFKILTFFYPNNLNYAKLKNHKNYHIL